MALTAYQDSIRLIAALLLTITDYLGIECFHIKKDGRNDIEEHIIPTILFRNQITCIIP